MLYKETFVLSVKYRMSSHSVQSYQGLSCSDMSRFWAVHNMDYLETFWRRETGVSQFHSSKAVPDLLLTLHEMVTGSIAKS